jgi:hypothetical protein
LPLEGKGSLWASPDDALWRWRGGEGGKGGPAARRRQELLVTRRSFSGFFLLIFIYLLLFSCWKNRTRVVFYKINQLTKKPSFIYFLGSTINNNKTP